MTYELIYHSHASNNFSSEVAEDILKSARNFNSLNNITGCLLFHNNEFLQILEGDQMTIQELFLKIKSDPRHYNVELISSKKIDKRLFSNWSMAFEELGSKDFEKFDEFIDFEGFENLHSVKYQSTFGSMLFHYLSNFRIPKISNRPV